MNTRKVLFIIFFICLISIVGILLYWHSENLAEERLQDYITRMEDDGFTVEEHCLTDFTVEGIVPIPFFGDFRSFAKQEDINQIYYDRGVHGLYFLRSTDGGTEADIFYCK